MFLWKLWKFPWSNVFILYLFKKLCKWKMENYYFFSSKILLDIFRCLSIYSVFSFYTWTSYTHGLFWCKICRQKKNLHFIHFCLKPFKNGWYRSKGAIYLENGVCVCEKLEKSECKISYPIITPHKFTSMFLIKTTWQNCVLKLWLFLVL